jgi:hypothetical protein
MSLLPPRVADGLAGPRHHTPGGLAYSRNLIPGGRDEAVTRGDHLLPANPAEESRMSSVKRSREIAPSRIPGTGDGFRRAVASRDDDALAIDATPSRPSLEGRPRTLERDPAPSPAEPEQARRSVSALEQTRTPAGTGIIAA